MENKIERLKNLLLGEGNSNLPIVWAMPDALNDVLAEAKTDGNFEAVATDLLKEFVQLSCEIEVILALDEEVKVREIARKELFKLYDDLNGYGLSKFHNDFSFDFQSKLAFMVAIDGAEITLDDIHEEMKNLSEREETVNNDNWLEMKHDFTPARDFLNELEKSKMDLQ